MRRFWHVAGHVAAALIYCSTFCYADMIGGPSPSLWNMLVRAPDIEGGNVSISYPHCITALVENGTFSTVTLPIGGDLPAGCKPKIINASTTRAQSIIGLTGSFPVSLPAGCGGAALPAGYSSYCLWPGQAVEFYNSGALGWQVSQNPGKWLTPSGTLVYVNPSGSDNNDCLATGAANACLHINTAIQLWASDLDCSISGANVTLDAGTHNNDQTGVIINYPLNCGVNRGEFVITGTGGHSAVEVTCNGGVNCFSVQEPSTVQLTGITIHPEGNGSVGVFSRQGGTADIGDIQFDATPSGAMISVATNAHVNFTGNIIINGAANEFLVCNFLSYCSVQATGGNTVNITGNYTFSTFEEAINGGIIDHGAGTTFAGAGAGTGTSGPSCAAQLNGIIHTAGGTIPGNSSTCGNSQTATQGQIVN